MNKKLNALLEGLSKEQLLRLVHNIYQTVKQEKNIVEMCLVSFDPKELYKKLEKKITQLKKSNAFIDYYEASIMAESIQNITNHIDKSLLSYSPDMSIHLCQKLIDASSSIFKRSDDSSGAIANAFFSVFRILDEAFVKSEISSEIIADYIFKIYNATNSKLNCLIIDYMKKTLQKSKNVNTSLEKLAKTKKMDPKLYTNLMEKILDSRTDVDAYIALMHKQYNLDNQNNNATKDRIICNIATRLNKALRANDAILWLKKINDNSCMLYDKNQLLAEAYRIEGKNDLAQKLLWKNFERSLNISQYNAYIKHASKKEKTIADKKTIIIIKNHDNLSVALELSFKLKNIEVIEELIIKRAQELNNLDPFSYRNLSDFLYENGKPLAATLLRRILATAVLSEGRFKYYKHAINDLIKAKEFSKHVKNWCGFVNHMQLMNDLYSLHKRKSSFWKLCQEHNLFIIPKKNR